MDGHLKARVSALARELARDEQERLRAAGTLVELEELACEIGDELTSQLVSSVMAERSNEAAEAATCECPDCGYCCGPGDPKLRELTGLRGKVRYHEPTFFCPVCRRSFFPGSGPRWPFGPCHGDAEVTPKDDLVGR